MTIPTILSGLHFQKPDKVKIGFIGVGARGFETLKLALNREDVLVSALADIDEKAATKAEGTFINPVRQQDRETLNKIANRTVMPVVNYRSAGNYTADKGIQKEADTVKGITSGFFATALRGDADTAKRLSSVDAETKPMTRVVLNKLISKSGIVKPILEF